MYIDLDDDSIRMVGIISDTAVSYALQAKRKLDVHPRFLALLRDGEVTNGVWTCDLEQLFQDLV